MYIANLPPVPNTREEIRAAFPKMTWFPDDEPPVGQRVWLGEAFTESWSHGVVVGRHVNTTPEHRPTCPSCTCPPNKMMDGMWIVEWKHPNGQTVQSLEYPPRLLTDPSE